MAKRYLFYLIAWMRRGIFSENGQNRFFAGINKSYHEPENQNAHQLVRSFKTFLESGSPIYYIEREGIGNGGSP